MNDPGKVPTPRGKTGARWVRLLEWVVLTGVLVLASAAFSLEASVNAVLE
ncbi:MAG TPA: hypothetical protein VM425_05305 [Myxococcota bacterium]|nr:hypothetical protein [Myxococcota bacterium]